jgi:phage terminase large subunit GpA-like protein
MPDRYEIQCPHCGGALVLPANNDEEVRAFWESCQDMEFLCPSCRQTFRGLCEKTDFPQEAAWGITVDKNGSRFNRSEKLRLKLFEMSRDPYIVPSADDWG